MSHSDLFVHLEVGDGEWVGINLSEQLGRRGVAKKITVRSARFTLGPSQIVGKIDWQDSCAPNVATVAPAARAS